MSEHVVAPATDIARPNRDGRSEKPQIRAFPAVGRSRLDPRTLRCRPSPLARRRGVEAPPRAHGSIEADDKPP
jgi:hypothetical protein